MTKYLFKANDDVLSFCKCKDEPAMSSGQLDCPWCGCGWLIACSKCACAFTFAEVRETDLTMKELGRRVFDRQGISDYDDQDLEEWGQAMTAALASFEVGDTVVYLDGGYFKVDAKNVQYDGYFASHELEDLPHALARKEPELLDRVLGNVDYWTERELEGD